MDTETFDEFRRVVYAKSGISLGPTKEALVSARVSKRLRALQLPDAETYLAFLKQRGNEDEYIHLIDAISTNVTSFFREASHFDFMTQALSKWLAQGQRKFTIWCAAASTGEEPYSIAMTAFEAFDGQNAQLRILATDISTNVLKQCKIGVYKADKVESVPPMLRHRYFEKIKGGGAAGHYGVTDALKAPITFNRLNLSVTPFPMKGPMDIIFIRNVMIYFDNDTRRKLLDEAHRLLKPNGYLIVGHSEGLTGMVSNFTLVKSSVYRK